MPSIDLKCIQNSNKKNIEPVSKPILKKPQHIDKAQKPILKNIQTDIQNNFLPEKTKIPNKNIEPLEKDTTEKPALSDHERLKRVKILELYRLEFPDKLASFKGKDFSKMSDEELDATRKEFDYTISSNSNLQMGVDLSAKALTLYEYVGKEYAGLRIDGISSISTSPEWTDAVKALMLKYIDSPVNHVEPENKLLFLLISNTLMLHQINEANAEVSKDKTIDKNVLVEEEKKPANDIIMNLKLKDINQKYDYL